MTARTVSESDRLVIVGASLAGLRAAQAARHAGYPGKISLVGAEEHLPYDRPPLSKRFLVPADNSGAPEPHDPSQESTVPTLADTDELRDGLGVDLRLGVTATGLDIDSREVLLGDRHRLPYDRLIIATGAAARRWSPSTRLTGLYYLRTLDDAIALRAALARSSDLVIIGAGFIGSEVAATATQLGIRVTVVEAQDVPLAQAVGETTGRALAQVHTQVGTTLRCGVNVTGFTGTDRIEHVHLSDGTTLDADTVLVGIGAVPTVDWLANSGLAVNDGISCDGFLATSAPSVYAAGDAARFPHPRRDGSLRLEHWTAAAEQGAHAAHNAIAPSNPRRYQPVPYVWSDWSSQRLQLLGDPHTDHPPTLLGDPASGCFTALYRDGDHFAAVLAMNRPRIVPKLRRLLAQRAPWTEALARANDLHAHHRPRRPA